MVYALSLKDLVTHGKHYRGHDKTTGLARICNWVLAFSRKPIEIVAAAADFDQAALLVESMAAEARLNPWLAKRIVYGAKRIKGPGGVLKILTADSATSFGLRADLVVCDEVTHWKKRDLWDTLWSGRQKRPGSVFVVITNGGTLGSWQHDIVEQVKLDNNLDSLRGTRTIRLLDGCRSYPT